MPALLLIGGIGLLVWLLSTQNASASVSDTNTVADSGASTFTETDANGTVITYPNTAGFRNHNPGNLAWLPDSEAYDGQIGRVQLSDEVVGVYDSMEKGVRALGKQVTKDVSVYGWNTPTLLVQHWATGATAQAQANYAATMAKACNCAVGDTFAFPQVLPDIVQAIIYGENGAQPIPENDIVVWLNS